MKKLKLPMVLLLLWASVSSCVFTEILPHQGSLDPKEETYEVTEFDEVDLGSNFDALIIPSEKFKITANGVERDINDLHVRVVNRTLKINYTNGSWLGRIGRDRMHITIEMPTIRSIDLSGACKAKIEDFGKISKLEADLSGAADLTLDIKITDLDAELSGASNLTVNNLCDILTADVSGASKINAFDADALEADLELSGASKVNLSVSKKLVVEASGASTVYYRGEPTIKKDLSGSSKVIKD